jgi:hypothetical protein
VSTLRASMRASGAPTQWWMPRPNATCRRGTWRLRSTSSSFELGGVVVGGAPERARSFGGDLGDELSEDVAVHPLRHDTTADELATSHVSTSIDRPEEATSR